MTFNQPGWTVQGDVYNTAGDLILSKNGGRDDFLAALRILKTNVKELEGIGDGDRIKLTEQLDETLGHAAADQPAKSQIIDTLSKMTDTLKALGGAAAGALALAKVVTALAAWASMFF